jgi:predicted RNase H-like nuclease
VNQPRRTGPRGPILPYQLLAGVTPARRGWLVVSGKIQGIQLSPNVPELVPNLADALDARPPYQVLALNAPVGLLEEPVQGGRRCDQEARRLLGWPRAGAILSPPTRRSLKASSIEEASELSGGLDAVTWYHFPMIREVAEEMAPYRQRFVYEVHPEMSFFQLNEDQPLRYPKRTNNGRAERRALLERRIPGVDRVLDAEIPGVRLWHLLDGCAALWTARRILAKAATRSPEDPVWDDEGLRMEIVR